MPSAANTLDDPLRAHGSRLRDQVAAAFLLALMAVGSATLWIGVPVGCSWVAAQLTSDQTAHLQITVPLTIAGMVVLARALFWINRLYVTINTPRLEPDAEDDEWPAQIRPGAAGADPRHLAGIRPDRPDGVVLRLGGEPAPARVLVAATCGLSTSTSPAHGAVQSARRLPCRAGRGRRDRAPTAGRRARAGRARRRQPPP